MNFGEALTMCRNGTKVRRKSWPKDSYLYCNNNHVVGYGPIGDISSILNLEAWAYCDDFEVYTTKAKISSLRPGDRFTMYGFYSTYKKLSNEFGIGTKKFLYTCDQTDHSLLYGCDDDIEVTLLKDK